MLTFCPFPEPGTGGCRRPCSCGEGAGRRLAVNRGRWAPSDKMGEAGCGQGCFHTRGFSRLPCRSPQKSVWSPSEGLNVTAFKGGGGEPEWLLAVCPLPQYRWFLKSYLGVCQRRPFFAPVETTELTLSPNANWQDGRGAEFAALRLPQPRALVGCCFSVANLDNGIFAPLVFNRL